LRRRRCRFASNLIPSIAYKPRLVVQSLLSSSPHHRSRKSIPFKFDFHATVSRQSHSTCFNQT
jgi:hypothetical protein